MNLPDRYLAIVNRLSALTYEGRVTWSEGGDPAAFIVSTHSASVQVGGTRPGEYYLSLLNENGVGLVLFVVQQFDAGYGELEALYLSARRSALRIDKKIEDLERELGELSEPG